MKRVLLIILILNLQRLYSQDTGAYRPPKLYEFVARDCFKNVKYSGRIKNDSVRPNNIFMGQRVWRTINLENKQNKVMFESRTGCDQVGFFEIIKYGLIEKKLNAFFSDNFSDAAKNRLTRDQIMKEISYTDSSEIASYDKDGNEKKAMVVEKKYLYNSDVKTYLLKEDWIMNTHNGKFEKKIIAIAPLMFEKKTDQVLPLFWLYYNEWKELFDSFEARNYFTEYVITYKEVLENKYFVSRVTKASNIFERLVKTYKSGQDINTENETIKEGLSKSEKDLFED